MFDFGQFQLQTPVLSFVLDTAVGVGRTAPRSRTLIAQAAASAAAPENAGAALDRIVVVDCAPWKVLASACGEILKHRVYVAVVPPLA